ncbi:MAG: mannose-1-phosphate guanylyltransferase/mannose-6-phosphate isomerase [Reinekea sp.]|jgi:mannose-1-phosphate guanylyltransferase/mannose-6-phosphate isomerase
MTITPIILCGGSGTRLWPLSRKSYPKQFVPLVGENTLFQSTVSRLTGPAFAAPLVLTNSDFRFIVAEQLVGLDIVPGTIVVLSRFSSGLFRAMFAMKERTNGKEIHR